MAAVIVRFWPKRKSRGAQSHGHPDAELGHNPGEREDISNANSLDGQPVI